jgi:hypothetical protein
MLRETTFLLGGALTVALGVALALGLLWAGAGWEFWNGYVAAGLAVAFGLGFVQVGRAERADRRRTLAEWEPGASPATKSSR